MGFVFSEVFKLSVELQSVYHSLFIGCIVFRLFLHYYLADYFFDSIHANSLGKIAIVQLKQDLKIFLENNIIDMLRNRGRFLFNSYD